MMYPVSYFAKIPSAAFVGLSCFNVFVGVISSLATFILQVLILTDSNAQVGSFNLFLLILYVMIIYIRRIVRNKIIQVWYAV